MDVRRDGLGVARTSPGDIIAIIAPATDGPFDLPLAIGSSAEIVTRHGRGPLPQAATYIRQAPIRGRTIGRPVVCVRCKTTTPGAVGAVDYTGMVGTARPVHDGVTEPNDDLQLGVKFITSGTVGTPGITYQTTSDGGGSWSTTKALGSAYVLTIPGTAADGSDDVSFIIEPSAAAITALIALAVEARTDTLAHLADTTVHIVADTSAEQVALNASTVPTTGAQAWAVLNLCSAALMAHLDNVTVHPGPDFVHVVTAADATNVPGGVTLGVNYKSVYNLHIGTALAAAPAGLKAATATETSEVVWDDDDLLTPADMDTYPRRPTLTSGGTTPANVPASVLIEGFSKAGVAQSETLNLVQSAGTVTATKAYRRTGLKFTFPAADDVDATVAVGYGKGVHQSADATNVIAAAAPSQGTVVAKDVFYADTDAPAPSDADLVDAFAALQASNTRKDMVLLGSPVLTTDTATAIKTIVDDLEALKVFRPVIVNFRRRAAAESAADYRAAMKVVFDPIDCDAMLACYNSVTLLSRIDKTAKYRRPVAWGVAAKAVAARPGEDISFVDKGLGVVPNASIRDAADNPLYHDESVSPGPDDDRFVTLTSQDGYKGVFITNPNTLAQAGTDLKWLQYYLAVAKVVASVKTTLTGLLSAQLEPTDDGHLAPHEVTDLQNNTETAALTDAKGWVSAIDVAIDNTGDLFSDPTIPVEVDITPFLYAKAFKVTLALRNPFQK